MINKISLKADDGDGIVFLGLFVCEKENTNKFCVSLET